MDIIRTSMVTDYRLFLPEIVELSKYTTQLITFWRDNSISGRTVSVPVCELESSVLCSSLEVVYYTSVILCAPFSLCWSNHRSWCSEWKQLCFFSFSQWFCHDEMSYQHSDHWPTVWHYNDNSFWGCNEFNPHEKTWPFFEFQQGKLLHIFSL